jgi:hypothetical protein
MAFDGSKQQAPVSGAFSAAMPPCAEIISGKLANHGLCG